MFLSFRLADHVSNAPHDTARGSALDTRRDLDCVLDAREHSSKMTPSDNSPTGFGMAVILRVACIAALTPTSNALLPQNNVNSCRESAFASPPGSLRIISVARRGSCYTSRRTPTTPTAPRVRPYSTRSSSRRHRHGHSCSDRYRGGTSMIAATTSSDEAPAGAQQTTATATSIDSPAAAVLAAHGMRRGDWEAFIRAGEVEFLKEGELLISQGDSYDEPGDRKVYLIVSGVLRLEVRGKPVARLQVGDFVGEGERRCAISVRIRTNHSIGM